MIKIKKLDVDCSYCKKRIKIEVPMDIIKDREYYPFEYIHVHGSPEHALMLFIDKNLVVRDTMVYDDLDIAKRQKEEYASITRMSEIDAFASIYTDSLRLKLFEILMRGPITEDGLLGLLEEEEDFDVQKFNLLVLPLRKTGLLTTSYLYETFFECFFLIKDFLVIRVPSQITTKRISKDNELKPYANAYKSRRNEVFREYYKKYLSNKEKQNEIIKSDLKILADRILEKIIRELRNGPKSSEKLTELTKSELIEKLINNNIVMKLGAKAETYYALLTDIKVEKFAPNYLLDAISTKLKNKEISLELAAKHLELLFKSD